MKLMIIYLKDYKKLLELQFYKYFFSYLIHLIQKLNNLNYVLNGDNNTLSIIIAKVLTGAQEKKLVKLLCGHKMAI